MAIIRFSPSLQAKEAEVRRPGGFGCAAAVLAAVVAVAACGGQGRPLGPEAAPENDSSWLAAVGFPLRERAALLHIDRAEISALRVDSLTELLVRAPRVEVRLRSDGRKQYLLHRTADWADPGCPLDFYVNGNLLRIRAGDIVELQRDRLWQPYNLNGLEIFDAEDAPVGEPSGCGAVLLWVGRLRDRDDPPFTSALTGRIVRQPGNQGIVGVTVTVQPGGLTAVTNRGGLFNFGEIPAAVYRIEADVPEWGKYATEIGLRANAVGDVLIEVERR